MKFFPFVVLIFFALVVHAQDPCGQVLFGSEVPTSAYPANFIEDILSNTSPCVSSTNPTYGLNAITLDEADLVPCAGDVLSGLWVEAPNHEPLCVYTYPPNAASVLGVEFMGDLQVGDQGFFIAIIGVPLGTGTVDNYVSTGYIPVNPVYHDTIDVFTCDPDSSGMVVTQSFLSQCGCDSIVTSVFYYQEVIVSIDGPDQICYGDTAQLTAQYSAGSGFQYLWSTGDTTQSIPLFEEGIYEVTVTSGGGCVFTASHVAGYYPINGLWIEAPGSVCLGDDIYLIEDSGYQSYVWTLPGGGVLSGAEVQFSATPSNDGVYYLRARDDGGCTLRDSVYIAVEPPVPLPDFPDLLACLDDTLGVYFGQALADTSTFYEWVNGRGYSYELNRPWIIKRNWRGTNYIRATTAGGCVTETAFELDAKRCKTRCDSIEIFFPNVFSPDGNGTNDRYLIGGDCTEYEITRFLIFDRWGGVVFERRNFCPGDTSAAWDGTVGGKPVEAGVYAYMARITDRLTGKVCLREGPITVLTVKQ